MFPESQPSQPNGQNPYNFQGGFNPFSMGAFQNYFYGGTPGGGVPSASSEPRYRNKRKQILSGVDNAKTPEDLTNIQNELDTLDADRQSYMNNALISGAYSSAGPVLGLIANQQGLNALENVNPESYVPQELKDAAGAATLAANSSAVPNQAQQTADILAASTKAAGDAQLAAITPEQVQLAAVRAQKGTNQAINNMATQGANIQRENKRYADSLKTKVGDARQQAKNLLELKKAELEEARVRNATNLADNLGRALLLMA